MHGFFGSYGKSYDWHFEDSKQESLIKRCYDTDNFHVTQTTLPKFLIDKYFIEEQDCFLAVEGVLLEADKASDAIRRYKQGEQCFWNAWRGSFAGIFYDKKTEELLLFNDHIGSKLLFYSRTSEGIVFASDIKMLTLQIEAKNYNPDFAKAIVEQAYVIDDSTFIEDIHRLTAGQYLLISKKRIEIKTYHRFDNTPYVYNEKQMLSQTDKLFRQAVERVVRKNEQEGLHHFFPLSGGLDSRMAQWVAHQIAKQPIKNFTYSQTGHYDHILPQQISSVLGNKWQFMPLDGGSYLTKVDEIASSTQWLINYNGPSEIYAFASQQDWTDKGVVLTGVNGDNILAVITDTRREINLLYGLSFAGNGLGSPQVLQLYTESYSPFCDVDFLEYVLHIPNTKRRNYAFYDKWILAFYPEAAQWHHKHEQIGHRHTMVTIAGRNIRLKDVPKRIIMSALKRMHIYDAYSIDEDSMNPYDRWAQNNPELIMALYRYFDQHKQELKQLPEAEQLTQLFNTGHVYDKCAVLTVLSALHQ